MPYKKRFSDIKYSPHEEWLYLFNSAGETKPMLIIYRQLYISKVTYTLAEEKTGKFKIYIDIPVNSMSESIHQYREDLWISTYEYRMSRTLLINTRILDI